MHAALQIRFIPARGRDAFLPDNMPYTSAYLPCVRTRVCFHRQHSPALRFGVSVLLRWAFLHFHLVCAKMPAQHSGFKC